MSGVFTTLRVRHGQPWFFEDHLVRLGLDADSVTARIAAACAGLEDARVRIRVRSGSDPIVEACAYAAPEHPWRLTPVEVSPPGDIVRRKTTERAYYEHARARAPGGDDALLHLSDGTLLETTIANFFLVSNGVLSTPPATAPILAGIARNRVLSAARSLGLPCDERSVTLQDLREAEACFVTNALLVAHPVAEISGARTFPSTGLARRLRDAVVSRIPQTRIIQ